MKRWLSSARERRGNVLVIVLASLAAVVAFTGVGIDIGRVISTKAQLQRAFDSAALAGASKLDLTTTGVTNATSAALTWSSKNSYTGGTPTFAAWSAGTNTTGNIQLGVWDFTTNSWTASTQPTVNALRCQWSANIPTPFLGIFGRTSISIAARSTAAASCPTLPPPGNPVAPFALPLCGFNNNGSSGCGALVEVTVNDWIALGPPGGGGAASEPTILGQLQYAADPSTGTAPPSIQPAGDPAAVNGGQLVNVFNALAKYSPSGGGSWTGIFKDKYTAATTYTVLDASQAQVYNGHGWSIYGGVANTTCSGGAFTTSATISTWVKFVMVQVIDGAGYCASPYSNPLWDSYCLSSVSVTGALSPGTSTTPSTTKKRTFFGYIDCSAINTNSAPPGPCPLIALGRPRLVQ